jgi:Spy/CpxP family protein refolding chaperone
MIIPKLGLMMLLTGVFGLAQQAPTPPQPRRTQVSPQVPVAEEERRRFEEIQARFNHGEIVSPEDQRFAREIRARLNQVVKPAVATQADRQGMQLRSTQPLGSAAAQPAQPARPPLERALGVPGGKWWTRPEMAQKLGLTADQTKKMDDIFQQSRLKLIDLNASLQKEEAIMEPLVEADPPEEAKIVSQIDKLAQARAELEKANARMLLGIRRLLTPEQWNKLKADSVKRPGVIVVDPQQFNR